MKRLLCLTIVVCLWTTPARAYVDGSPTLGQVMRDATNIVVLEVTKVSVEKRVIIYKKVADLKGQYPSEEVRHAIGDGSHPREPMTVLDLARPGQLALCFTNGKVAQMCLGQYWYECVAQQVPWWTMTRGLPERALAYIGSTTRLREHVSAMLAGKEVVLTAVSNRFNGFSAHGAVALKTVLRGKQFVIWRVKGSLNMPARAFDLVNTSWVIGAGAGTAEDVPGLVERLQNTAPHIRRDAAEDLGLIGPPARPALSALAKALKDADGTVRVAAAEALARIDPGHKEAVPALVAALNDQAPPVRKAAAESLGNIGPEAKSAVAALAAALKDADGNVRWASAEALGRIGPDAAAAIPALAAALTDESIKSLAADALGSIGSGARNVVPQLAKLLQDANPGVRRTAAIALSRVGGPGVKAALPELVQMLQSSDERIYWDSIQQFAMLGAEAKEAIPALKETFKARTNMYSAYALLCVAGGEATETIPIFLPILQGGNEDSAWCLGQIPGAAQPLLQTLQDKKQLHRGLAAKALGLIGRKAMEVVPGLIAQLKDPDPRVRQAIIDALAKVDPKAKEAVPALSAALQDGDVWVRHSACWALIGVLGPEARAVVPVLNGSLQHQEIWVRRSAAHALGALGKPAHDAAPALSTALKDTDAGVRITAAWALVMAGVSPAKTAVPLIMPALQDKDTWTRQYAATFLGTMGSAVKETLPALRQLLEDPNEEVRKAAAEAIRRVQ